MTNPPNTTPLNEEDRLGEIKKIILESGVLDEHDKNVGGDLYSSKGNQELTADALAQYIAPNITKLIQTLEKKARIDEVNKLDVHLDSLNTPLEEHPQNRLSIIRTYNQSRIAQITQLQGAENE